MRYTQKQKSKKKIKKIGLIIAISVVSAFLLNIVFNQFKYNANVYVAVSYLSNSKYWVNEPISLEIKNKAFEDISSLSAIMYFYDENGSKIGATIIDFFDLPAWELQHVDVFLNLDIKQRLYGYDPSSVKITFAVTQVYFMDLTYKDFGKGREREIKASEKIRNG